MSFRDISTQEPVLQAIREFDRLGREAFLRKYGFGRARDYFLEYAGRRYDSKAIVGAAHGYALPSEGPLRPEDFSGGDATVATLLRGLGFEVTAAGSAISPEAVNGDRRDWSATEIALTVNDYFTMFRSEIDGSPYNKAEHRRGLLPQLNGRTPAAIEYKLSLAVSE